MSNFNGFTPNLKFSFTSSEKNILFLDLKVFSTKDKLSTDLWNHKNRHIKHTDCHYYLPYPSGHPEHTKRSTVYSQLLRVT